MAHGKGFGNTLAAGDGIHAGAMALGVNMSDEAVLVERQITQACEFAREQRGLIEAALTLAFRMQRNGDDQVSGVERLAALELKRQLSQSPDDVRFSFQIQNRSAQGSFINSAGSRSGKGGVVASTATDHFSLLAINHCPSKHTALPA